MNAETDSIVRRLLGKGSIYTLALAAQLSMGVLTLPIVTRLLNADEYGTVAAAAVVRQLLAVLIALGMPAAIARFYFNRDNPARSGGEREARSLVATTVAGALIGAAIADLTGPWWSAIYSDIDYAGALRVATWSSVPLVAVIASQALLRAQERAGWFVGAAVVATVGAQGLGIAAIAIFEPEAVFYLAGVGLGFALAALMALAVARPLWRGILDRRLTLGALAFGLPTVAHATAIYVLQAGDRVVVERLEGLEAVGRYQVAYLIGGLALALLAALNNAWAPLIYGVNDDKRWTTLAETTTVVMRLVGLVAAGLAMLAPLLLVIAAPSDYDPADLTRVVGLIALAGLPMAWYLGNVHVIFQLERTGPLAIITPTVAVLNIVLNYLLVPGLSLAGAALATTLGYLALGFLVGLVARRLANVPWAGGRLVGATAVGTGLVVVGMVLPASGSWLAIRTVLAIGLGVVLVSVVVRSTRPVGTVVGSG